jgi:formate dehydrogenase subunit delta
VETTTLVRMANQIADYFKSYPEDEAVAEITKHLKSFWDPRMRQRLSTAIQDPAIEAKLDPMVVRSLSSKR